jgi:hypothetical protein
MILTTTLREGKTKEIRQGHRWPGLPWLACISRRQRREMQEIPIKKPKSKANIKFEMPSSQLSVSQNPDVFEFWSLNIWDLGCGIWNSQRSQSHPLNSLQPIDR